MQHMTAIGYVSEKHTVGGFDGCATSTETFIVFKKDDGETFAQSIVTGEKKEVSPALIEEGHEKYGQNPRVEQWFKSY